MVNRTNKRIIAIIPARGGSKRIPKKNITLVNGLPLIAYSILDAKRSQRIQEVYVSTDDQKISKVARNFGAEVIMRPKNISGGKASSESALVHVLDELKGKGMTDPYLVVFLQATSPLRKKDDIDNAIKLLETKKMDSVFSACKDKGLMWFEKSGKVKAINYDYKKRKREQDMGVQFRENGSIYVFKSSILRRLNNRMGGKIGIYEMDLPHSFQVDEPKDIEFIENLQILTKPIDAKQLPKTVKLVVFDFDGVFTDNKVKSDKNGNESVTNSRADSLGLSWLKKARIPAMVLSTEKHPVVAARCKKLGIECHQGIGNKKNYLKTFLSKRKISAKNVVYVGNDLNDLECFKYVGYSAAPADSNPEIIKIADHVLSHKGGNGAVREICELILKK